MHVSVKGAKAAATNGRQLGLLVVWNTSLVKNAGLTAVFTRRHVRSRAPLLPPCKRQQRAANPDMATAIAAAAYSAAGC